MNNLQSILNTEYGQGLVEYSLILSLVGIAAIGAVILFGESASVLYERIIEDVTSSW